MSSHLVDVAMQHRHIEINVTALSLRAMGLHLPGSSFVNPNTRFWHASGVDVKMDANGIRVDTQSLVSILIGGVVRRRSRPVLLFKASPHGGAMNAITN